MAIVEFGRHFLWLKLLQFVVGIICYALYFRFAWGGKWYGTDVVESNITQVAAVAFPFVVLPVVILTSFLQGEGLADHMICALFSFCGFLVALVGGSITISTAVGTNAAGVKAAGAISIIFSFIFLVDVVLYAYKRIKGPR